MGKIPTLGLCMIVKPTDQEAYLLERVLRQTKGYFNKTFITITGENKTIERMAKSYGAVVSHIPWHNNFAEARNYNFSQADTDYIMWLDADDLVDGIEHLPNLMKNMSDEKSALDAIVMAYLYDFDEYRICVVKHLKTRIIKNDGCLEWAGALHEDFKENRKVYAEKCEEIKIIHATNEERIRDNLARNTEIAKNTLSTYPDDPRSYWLVANALLTEGKGEEALAYYYDFIEKSSSEEEIYLAYHRIASIFEEMNELERAYMAELQAFRLRPWYPDPYYGLGKIYFKENKFKAAETVTLDGLKKPIPENEMIVWNPRDYDVNPLNLLARIYWAMDKPLEAKACLENILKVYPHREDIKKIVVEIEKREKELEKVKVAVEQIKQAKTKEEIAVILKDLPISVQSHPMICNIRNNNFIKETTSGRDLVIYCGFTEEQWTPKTAEEKGIGGSEEAVINLTKNLVSLGWNVEVYNNCGHEVQEFDGVLYKPFWMWNYRDRQDVVIVWRVPKILDFEINAAFIGLDLHDVIRPGELNSLRLNRVDKIFVKSQAHRELFPHVEDEKFAVIPNGVDVSLFDNVTVKRDPYYLVNFSSPDRSLESLLDIFEEVVKRIPSEIAKKVKLGWFYGWGVFDSELSHDKEAMGWKKQVLDKFQILFARGLVEGGYRINHQDVAIKNLQAGALLYPTEFYEIDYIGGSKAQIAGCVPITTDFAALNEKIEYGVKIHSPLTKENWTEGIKYNFGLKDKDRKERFIETVVEYLKNPAKWDKAREEMSQWAKEKYNWQTITDQWNKILQTVEINQNLHNAKVYH